MQHPVDTDPSDHLGCPVCGPHGHHRLARPAARLGGRTDTTMHAPTHDVWRAGALHSTSPEGRPRLGCSDRAGRRRVLALHPLHATRLGLPQPCRARAQHLALRRMLVPQQGRSRFCSVRGTSTVYTDGRRTPAHLFAVAPKLHLSEHAVLASILPSVHHRSAAYPMRGRISRRSFFCGRHTGLSGVLGTWAGCITLLTIFLLTRGGS